MDDNVSSVKLFFRSQTNTNHGSKRKKYMYIEREGEREREKGNDTTENWREKER